MLQDVDEIDLLAKGAVSISFDGVESFIEQYDEFYEKVENRKRELSEDS